MEYVIDLFNTIWNNLNSRNFVNLLVLIVLGLIIYLLAKIIDNNIKSITKFLFGRFKSKEKKHRDAMNYRRNVTLTIKQLLSDLAISIKSSCIILFEYSNGNSNIAGLPFMFLNATQEINSINCSSVSDKFKKLNVSLFSDFLIELEEIIKKYKI